MKEKKARITKITSEINQAMYDDKLGAKNSRIRDLEEKREELNGEFKALNGQADARAKLQHRREEIKKKGGEIKNTYALPCTLRSPATLMSTIVSTLPT